MDVKNEIISDVKLMRNWQNTMDDTEADRVFYEECNDEQEWLEFLNNHVLNYNEEKQEAVSESVEVELIPEDDYYEEKEENCFSMSDSEDEELIPEDTEMDIDSIFSTVIEKKNIKQMEKVIQKALDPSGKFTIKRYNIEIGWKDFQRLNGLNWLNDNLINLYFHMIAERGSRTGVKIYAPNTLFFTKMMLGGQPLLKRWTMRSDIFSHDLMFIPIHLGTHWTLAVVDFKKPGVYYYDSQMTGANKECFLNVLLKYLQDEHKDKKGVDLDVSKFEARVMEGIPRQLNGSDCGVFVCKTAEFLSRRAPLNFSQEDMPNFRKQMIWEIYKDTLLQQ